MSTSLSGRINPQKLLCFIVLVFFIGIRVFSFSAFSLRYTDQDQVLMWYGAKEMAAGHFHEPCFYGQSYNSMLESLMAVPLIKAGIPYSFALPFVSFNMGLFPWLMFFILFLTRKEYWKAFIILGLATIMNLEYDVICAMPRGWVTGLFVASIAIPAYFKPGNRVAWVLFGFCATAGLWLNPNSIYLTAFIGLHLLLKNWNKPAFYLLVLAGTILPVAWWIYSWNFYQVHPGTVMHGSTPMDFSLLRWLESFKHLDTYFKYLGLVSGVTGWLTFFIRETVFSRAEGELKILVEQSPRLRRERV